LALCFVLFLSTSPKPPIPNPQSAIKYSAIDKMVSLIGRKLADVRDAALATVFPTACRVCGEIVDSWRDGIACAQCWEQIENRRPAENSCAKCGLPLLPLPARLRIDERRCGRCEDFAFNYARSCGPYRGALRESVLWLKTREQFPPRLRKILLETFLQLDGMQSCDLLIPMPLHPTRLAERKFNQAEIIANALSSDAGARVTTAAIVRIKPTAKHRAGMGARERARSLSRAFRVRAPRLIENRSVMVVDDVMTTGSTAHEIARTLIDAGAGAVSVLTLARAASEYS
jgi:ComF family protein